MIIGNPDAAIRLIMVTNLYCNPCKNAHGAITELLQMYPEQVSVALRFIQSGKDEVTRNETVPYVIDYWLRSIKGTAEESSQTERLIHDWFEIWDLEKYKMRHPLDNKFSEEAKAMATQHHAWANREAIHSTPTFFMNGLKLPNEYTISDLLAMIPELSTNINQLMSKEMITQ